MYSSLYNYTACTSTSVTRSINFFWCFSVISASNWSCISARWDERQITIKCNIWYQLSVKNLSSASRSSQPLLYYKSSALSTELSGRSTRSVKSEAGRFPIGCRYYFKNRTKDCTRIIMRSFQSCYYYDIDTYSCRPCNKPEK